MTQLNLPVTLLNHLIHVTVVLGNLKLNAAFWEHIGASRFIRDTILDGYKIPFIYTPPSAHFSNNRSTIQYSDFVGRPFLISWPQVQWLNASLPILSLTPYHSLHRLTVRKGLFWIYGTLIILL